MNRIGLAVLGGAEWVLANLARIKPLGGICGQALDRLRRYRAARAARRPPFEPAPSGVERVVARLARFRWLRPLMEGILPTPHFLEGESVQLEVRMAPYRLHIALALFRAALAFASFVALGLIVISAMRVAAVLQALVGFLLFLSVYGVISTIRQLLLYYQWRFILTNKRIIIVAPDAQRRGFADVVYLKGGRIQVVDTAWSSSPLWGFYQAMTGARDVILSLAGYEFKPEGAEVKGGLRFPDVMPEDIKRIEELIFS
ncbi:MAG: hypothetical protein NZ769_04530 [Anaerolineae bacterium]|nr:hypothetical protein [Anaerolineae bacterium]